MSDMQTATLAFISNQGRELEKAAARLRVARERKNAADAVACDYAQQTVVLTVRLNQALAELEAAHLRIADHENDRRAWGEDRAKAAQTQHPGEFLLAFCAQAFPRVSLKWLPDDGWSAEDPSQLALFHGVTRGHFAQLLVMLDQALPNGPKL